MGMTVVFMSEVDAEWQTVSVRVKGENHIKSKFYRRQER